MGLKKTKKCTAKINTGNLPRREVKKSYLYVMFN